MRGHVEAHAKEPTTVQFLFGPSNFCEHDVRARSFGGSGSMPAAVETWCHKRFVVAIQSPSLRPTETSTFHGGGALLEMPFLGLKSLEPRQSLQICRALGRGAKATR